MTPEEPAPAGAAKKERPLRRRYKQQISVRLDENLLELAKQTAAKQRWPFAVVVEKSIWQWLKSIGANTKKVTSGRLVWETLPPDLQQDTYAFWAWRSCGSLPPFQAALRETTLISLREFQKTKEYLPSLQSMGIHPEPEEEPADT